MYRKLFVGCLCVLACLPVQVAMSKPSYLDDLVRQAKILKLAEHKEWLNLVHYKTNFFTGYTSEIISQDFFNAPNGMTNPEAELDATLTSFFSNKKETDKQQNRSSHKF